MNLLLQHPPKSKSTLTVSNHHANESSTTVTANRHSLNPITVDTTATRTSPPSSSSSHASSTPSSQSSSQSSPTKLLTGLLNNTVSNAYKTTPSISISSLHSLSSVSISSAQSINSYTQNYNQNRILLDFISTLKSPAQNIYIIDNVQDTLLLLNLYYSTSDNKLPSVQEVFPYLHGLNSVKQKIFFNEELNENPVINEKLSNSLDLRDYNETEYNKDDVEAPSLSQHFPLTFVTGDEEDDEYNLINSITLNDLLMPESDDGLEGSFIEQISYKPFSHVNKINPKTKYDLNNRNFKSQIKLVAPFTNFFVYNKENNFTANLANAKLISKSLDESSRQVIFILDLPNWMAESQLSPYLERNSEFFNSEYISNPVLDAGEAEEESSNNSFGSKLLKWEQNLIWKLNSMKWLDKGVCLGTIVDFNRLTAKGPATSPFKLYINCHQSAHFPELSVLNEILMKLESDGIDGHLDAMYLEFPSAGSLNNASITFEEILCYLNVLKIIKLLTLKNYDVFIFCYDGFTGLSLLTISVAYLLKLDPENKLTCEDVILDILTDFPKDLRLYFFKNDLLFLKNLEKFISWVHFEKINLHVQDKHLCGNRKDGFDYQLILDLEHNNINKKSKSLNKAGNRVTSASPMLDWFDLDQDNNFPSRILDSLYLGSLNHASSTTLLNAIKITRIVSLGEKPLWFNYLNEFITFEHEVTNGSSKKRNKSVKIIRPTYSYNFVKIYIIELNSGSSSLRLHKLPHLKKIVYIHNLKDDGKDSILPLLTDIPDAVRNEILVDPEAGNDKTLVHCRIGVSRSATVVIATLMKFLKWSLPQAYMFVRVKRFNIIIQPNLKVFYELLLYEEYLRDGKGSRTICWESLCHEIYKLNNHYISSSI